MHRSKYSITNKNAIKSINPQPELFFNIIPKGHLTHISTLSTASPAYLPEAAVGGPFNANKAKCPPTTGLAMNGPSAKLAKHVSLTAISSS
jgi:hypothetical protein